jgi:cellulose synthase/poly-beta-1,6-N-acetylglucosamine synthase-like glycosyltransferase
MSAALLVFIGAVLLLGYIFVGYPLIVWTMARFGQRAPLRDASYRPSVEAVVVAHNEGKTIGRKIQNLLALDYPEDRLSVLVVSDASSDETCDIVRALGNPRVRLLHFDEKSSKAACLNRAIATSRAEVLLLTDCRQALAKDVLLRLVAPLADPTVAAASGELVFEQEGENDFSKGMDAYWRYEKFIRKCESAIGSTVGVTGAIYVLRRDAYIPIPEETLLDDVLIPMNVVMAGQRVLFESEAYAFDVPSSDPAREKRRKTRTIAGNFQLPSLSPALLSPRANPIWWQFVSHKMLRLLAPLLLVAALVSNWLIADLHPILMATLIGQLLVHGLVLLSLMFDNLRAFRVIRIARAFHDLMYFTVLGAWTFFRGRALSSWK